MMYICFSLMLVRKVNAVEEKTEIEMFSATHVMWIEYIELNSIQLKVHELHGYVTNIIHPYM